MNAHVYRIAILLAGVSAAAPLESFGSAPEEAVHMSTYARLPIKELTVFKDGHALVAHQGSLPTDGNGNAVMAYLPSAVLGTFWPYSAEPNARLTSVVASRKRVLVGRTALNLRDLLEANLGAEANITESGSNYDATIISLPARSAEELASTSPPNTPERLPEKGGLVLLKTTGGIRAVGIDRIQEVTFKHDCKPAVDEEEFRDLLTLKLDWGRSKPGKNAKVGLFYLQKGFRWIPSYKVDLDGKGNANVKLQGTLLNELADIEDVSLNLVVGVPTFAFKDMLDPMSLQQSLAQLSPYFQGGGVNQNSPFASNFSNGIMAQTQAARADFDFSATTGPAGSLGPELGDTGKTEDQFVYTVHHVTLKKGERMVLTLAEFTLPYKDIFTLDLPFGPPPELRGNINNQQERELSKLLHAPKVMHKARLTNSSKYPLTTAPALITREGKVLAQGLMTYAATDASVDLPITTALDFQVKKSDLETQRTSNALRENGNSYSRIDLKGTINVVSHRRQPTELEIHRFVLGAADGATNAGKIEKLNAFEDDNWFTEDPHPYWWGWYGWPWWWSHVNGIARISWKVTLEPGEALELGYDWHYFWQ